MNTTAASRWPGFEVQLQVRIAPVRLWLAVIAVLRSRLSSSKWSRSRLTSSRSFGGKAPSTWPRAGWAGLTGYDAAED